MATTQKSAPIPPREAARMISNYLNEPDLAGLASRALGGTIPRASFFSFQPGFKGSQFWFCYNSLEVNPLFLAVEQCQYDWNPNDPPLDPFHTELHAPTPDDVFTYTGPSTSQIDVENYLLNHTKPHSGNVRRVTDNQVSQHSRTFRSNFGTNRKYYCEYPVGFFVAEGRDTTGKTQTWFQNFLGPDPGPVAYVRYYFGYENKTTAGDDDKPNRIRIILIATDINGTNIFPHARTGGDSGVLQKSFPPPPAP